MLPLIAYGIREQGVKPYQWAFDPALVAPEWQWAHEDLALAIVNWEGAGGPHDLSPYRSDMVPAGGAAPTWASTQMGVASRHLNQYFLGAANYAAPVTSAVTISLLIYPTDITSNQYAVDAVNKRAIILGYQDGNFNIYNSGYPTGAAADTQMPATVNAWNHVVYGSDGSTVKGYMNGIEKLSVSANLNATSITTFSLGANTAGGDALQTAFVASYLIWNQFLSATQIVQLATDPFGPFRMDLSRLFQRGVLLGTSYDETGRLVTPLISLTSRELFSVGGAHGGGGGGPGAIFYP